MGDLTGGFCGEDVGGGGGGVVIGCACHCDEWVVRMMRVCEMVMNEDERIG